MNWDNLRNSIDNINNYSSFDIDTISNNIYKFHIKQSLDNEIRKKTIKIIKDNLIGKRLNQYKKTEVILHNELIKDNRINKIYYSKKYNNYEISIYFKDWKGMNDCLNITIRDNDTNTFNIKELDYLLQFTKEKYLIPNLKDIKEELIKLQNETIKEVELRKRSYRNENYNYINCIKNELIKVSIRNQERRV